MRRLPFLFFAFLFFLPPISPAKELPKIAVWDLTPGDIKASYVQDLTSILVSEIVKLNKYEVYSQDNVRALAGWTGERIRLGCTDTKCLVALGQMDISKLISGRVGKIGNTYSVSLNLFDTQNARSENAISEFCRTDDELIVLVQQAARKLLAVQVETSSLRAVPVDKGPPPLTGLPTASGTLEIRAKVQGAQVLIGGQNMGEIPLRVSNLAPGSHEVQVVKKGYEVWKQQVLIQPNEKKVIEVVLNRSPEGEEYFFDKIFYFDNCSFGRDKFEYWVKFRRGGILEGTPRMGANYEKPPREPGRFKPLDSRWLVEKNRIIIDFKILRGIDTRKVLRIEIQLDNIREGIFACVAESSKSVSTTPWFSPTDTVKYSCFMKEWHSP
ncbi:MAG: PEGA domain-containing protein [Deltaproteobacteria bacterium]|nr:PEGA domain-containing protein [Deltaproteobacteria bacterium]